MKSPDFLPPQRTCLFSSCRSPSQLKLKKLSNKTS